MGGGAAQAMITILRNNRNLLSKRANYFQRDVNTGDTTNKIIDHKKLSEYDRKIIQKKIREQNALILKKRLLIFGICMVIIISGLGYLLFYF